MDRLGNDGVSLSIGHAPEFPAVLGRIRAHKSAGWADDLENAIGCDDGGGGERELFFGG